MHRKVGLSREIEIIFKNRKFKLKNIISNIKNLAKWKQRKRVNLKIDLRNCPICKTERKKLKKRNSRVSKECETISKD